MAQPETGGVRTTEGDGDMLETPSDDEEITIPSQDNANIRNVDIHDEQSENTQREDWLLPTEPRHGARPPETPIRDVVDVGDVGAFGKAMPTRRLAGGCGH